MMQPIAHLPCRQDAISPIRAVRRMAGIWRETRRLNLTTQAQEIAGKINSRVVVTTMLVLLIYVRAKSG